MIEIPESINIARQLNKEIKGKEIKNVIVGKSAHKFAFYSCDPQFYNQLLTGKKIDGANYCGGYIEVYIEDKRLIFNDGTNIRFLADTEQLPAKHQLLMEFTDNTCIVCTVQMYGGIQVFDKDEPFGEYYDIAKSKPNPLSDEFDEKYFEGLVKEAPDKISIKAFLATNQRIPGLGNGVLQDILFKAGQNPKTKIRLLDDDKLNLLFGSIKNTLKDMVDYGGRNTEKDIYGKNGGYIALLSKNTVFKPCLVCGDKIIRQAYLGGNIYYCPTCQPEI